MFDNVIGQEALVKTLISDIQNNTLPRAILLHGPRYSGKLTLALELARVLHCRQTDAPWGCTCSQCNQHRLLMSPYTLMLGPRYFLDEIALTSRALVADDREPLRYLFVRSIRKLTNRFDGTLWEGEDQKLSKAIPLIDSIEQAMEPLLPGSEALLKKRDSQVSKIRDICEKLVTLLPADGHSVHFIRKASYWAHMTSTTARKVIILEDTERLNESSRNSLLKILEEPPEGSFFILLTTRLTGIIPTLRSRLRVYHCPGRTEELENQVLQRIFRLSPEPGTSQFQSPLQRTFENQLSKGDVDTWIEEFYRALEAPSGSFPLVVRVGQWIESVTPGLRRDLVRQFLQGLTRRIQRELVEAPTDGGAAGTFQKQHRILQTIDQQYQRYEQYNIPLATVIEQIFFAGTEV